MIRFSARLLSVGCETFKQSNVRHLNTSLLRPLAQNMTVGDVNCMDIPNPQIVSYLVNSMENLGFREEDIKFAVQNQPDLIKKPPAVWNSVLGALLGCGIGKKAVLSILKKWPDVLSLKKSELDQNLEAWFRCDLGGELTINVLTTHPYFLKVHHTIVEKRVKQYQAYFESKKRVGTLLLLAPNTLTEDFDELFNKINYLNELCTEKSDLASTGVLAHTAQHIRARHEFLIRAGCYKRPARNFNKKLSKNPKLVDIVNSSDKEFAVKVAGLTLLEYEVFTDMFEKEYKEIVKQELDSDDEEELNKLSYGKSRKSRKR